MLTAKVGLGEYSVPMELFVDDVWVVNCINFIQPVPSDKVFNHNGFVRCVDYLEEIIEIERKLLSQMKNLHLLKYSTKTSSKKTYEGLIGKGVVSEQLYNGLKASFDRYYKSYKEDELSIHAFEDRLIDINKEIIELKRDIWDK